MEKTLNLQRKNNKKLAKFIDFSSQQTVPFNSDWNLLMKVCEKILNLYPMCTYNTYVDMESTLHNDRNYTIKFNHYRLFNIEVTRKTHLNTLYEACVEFVVWYDKNNVTKSI